jgi:hypothetical protein
MEGDAGTRRLDPPMSLLVPQRRAHTRSHTTDGLFNTELGATWRK